MEENKKIKRKNQTHSFAYEVIQEMKRKGRREHQEKVFLIKALIVAVIALVVSNIAWLIFFNQFDMNGEVTSVDGGNGIATYLENSESGDINYGKDY